MLSRDTSKTDSLLQAEEIVDDRRVMIPMLPPTFGRHCDLLLKGLFYLHYQIRRALQVCHASPPRPIRWGFDGRSTARYDFRIIGIAIVAIKTQCPQRIRRGRVQDDTKVAESEPSHPLRLESRRHQQDLTKPPYCGRQIFHAIVHV